MLIHSVFRVVRTTCSPIFLSPSLTSACKIRCSDYRGCHTAVPEPAAKQNLAQITPDDLQPSTRHLYDNLLKGNRAALAKSITLVESSLEENVLEARKLMTLVTQHARNERLKTFRIGLSGPPGAGKSTFIEAFGKMLTARGNKVAVLAVDPSSARRGGSLLGDQTRMTELSRDPNAYIRPSPNRGHLGGVARTTNESIQLCEACGYDTVLVETVGVGQSEHMVANMVDTLCLVLAPGAGDELQGIKRGIVEQCDLVLVNKSDGDMKPVARRTKAEYVSALKFMQPKSAAWRTEVLLMSSKTGYGLELVMDILDEFNETMSENGELDRRRAMQHKKWLWNYIHHRLLEIFNNSVKHKKTRYEDMVMADVITPGVASDLLIQEFIKDQQRQQK